jgi:hypothetical protein
MVIFGTEGQELKQLIELGAAFLLSALIGLEREVRRKSAGLSYLHLWSAPPQLSSCSSPSLASRTFLLLTWSSLTPLVSLPDRHRHRLHWNWTHLRSRGSSQRPHYRRYHLARHHGQVLSRDRLLENVWIPWENEDGRVVDSRAG